MGRRGATWEHPWDPALHNCQHLSEACLDVVTPGVQQFYTDCLMHSPNAFRLKTDAGLAQTGLIAQVSSLFLRDSRERAALDTWREKLGKELASYTIVKTELWWIDCTFLAMAVTKEADRIADRSSKWANLKRWRLLLRPRMDTSNVVGSLNLQSLLSLKSNKTSCEYGCESTPSMSSNLYSGGLLTSYCYKENSELRALPEDHIADEDMDNALPPPTTQPVALLLGRISHRTSRLCREIEAHRSHDDYVFRETPSDFVVGESPSDLMVSFPDEQNCWAASCGACCTSVSPIVSKSSLGANISTFDSDADANAMIRTVTLAQLHE